MKKLLPFIVALLISNTLFGQLPQLPTTGLLAWYPFCNGSLNDLSVDAYNLLIWPGPAPAVTADRFPNPNTAFNFNGASALYYPVPFFNAAGFSSSNFTYVST